MNLQFYNRFYVWNLLSKESHFRYLCNVSPPLATFFFCTSGPIPILFNSNHIMETIIDSRKANPT